MTGRGADAPAALSSTPSGGFAIPIPWRDEGSRLAAVRSYGEFDPVADLEFEAIVREAARVCGTPIALVSMVDAERQWFRAQVGLDAHETPREVSFCAHAIHHDDLFIVPDAAADDRFRGNPLVEGDPEIRFYAGMPLISPEGYPLGTLCVIDRVPRKLSVAQEDELRRLAREVIRRLEARRRKQASDTGAVARPDSGRARRRNPLAIAWSALAVIFLLFLALQWVHARVARDVAAANELVDASHDVIERLDEVVNGLVTAETSVRGFALSEEEEFLESYRIARRAIEPKLAALSRELSSEPARLVLAEDLAARVRAKFAVLEETISARLDAGPEAAATVAATRGRETMRRVEALAGEIRAAESARLEANREAIRRATRRERRVLVAGTAFSGLLLLLVFVIVRREIVARGRSEASLREEKDFISAVVKNANTLVVVLDRMGRIQRFNRACERLSGSAAEAVLGAPYWEIFLPPEKRAETAAWFSSLRPTDFPSRYESVHTGREGQSFLIEWANSAILNESGELKSVVSCGTDLTEKRHAEAALRANEERTRSIIENLHEGLVIVGVHDARIAQVNAAAERMFGYAPGELLGRHLGELVPPGSAGDAGEFLRSSYEKAIGRVSEWEGLRKDGSVFPFELAMTRFRTADGEFVTGSLRDISERAKIDRLKREFVSTVSHELRTPLTSIRGSLGLVAGTMGAAIPEGARELVEIALRNSERLSRLVDDILDIEKIEAGRLEFRLEPLDLGDLARQAVAAIEGFAAQHGVTVEIVAGESELRVMGDEGRLMQVFTNLLSNAVKFSPPQSAVRVELARRGARLRAAVHDRGPGIALEFASRIFGRFQQADGSDARQRGGTGLGLSISKAIVERLGGSIGFDSEVGAGSCFHFELDALDAPDAASAESAGRILICEDDADLAHLLRLLLRQAGFESSVARNAAEARRLLAEQPFDAMTLDLVLPGESGIELLRGLRAAPATASLPVVVVSARANEGIEGLDGAGLAVADWLEKPIDPARLLRSLRASLSDLSSQGAVVLHVEDDPDAQQVVRRILAAESTVVSAIDLESARRQLAGRRFDLVVLDLGLPDGSGLELLPDLAALGDDAPPVVIFSGSAPAAELAQQVAGVLVKGRATHEDLAAKIRSVIARRAASAPRDAAPAGSAS